MFENELNTPRELNVEETQGASPVATRGVDLTTSSAIYNAGFTATSPPTNYSMKMEVPIVEVNFKVFIQGSFEIKYTQTITSE